MEVHVRHQEERGGCSPVAVPLLSDVWTWVSLALSKWIDSSESPDLYPQT